nr:MAG TPA: hypothetical protein [Caudoviricetes sp.]
MIIEFPFIGLEIIVALSLPFCKEPFSSTTALPLIYSGNTLIWSPNLFRFALAWSPSLLTKINWEFVVPNLYAHVNNATADSVLPCSFC